MAYASLPDVMALTPARVYTASSRPATTQVAVFLDENAAILDSILVEKGYSLPIPTSASSALLLLRRLNVQGAVADVERAAEASETRDLAQNAWTAALEMLRAAESVLDIPKDQTRALPRGPGVTTPQGVALGATFDPNFPETDSHGNVIPPVGNGNVPMFSRSMQF